MIGPSLSNLVKVQGDGINKINEENINVPDLRPPAESMV